MTDRKLAQAILHFDIPSFGGSEKNKTTRARASFVRAVCSPRWSARLHRRTARRHRPHVGSPPSPMHQVDDPAPIAAPTGQPVASVVDREHLAPDYPPVRPRVASRSLNRDLAV
jgi:hypothetical protein